MKLEINNCLYVKYLKQILALKNLLFLVCKERKNDEYLAD